MIKFSISDKFAFVPDHRKDITEGQRVLCGDYWKLKDGAADGLTGTPAFDQHKRDANEARP